MRAFLIAAALIAALIGAAPAPRPSASPAPACGYVEFKPFTAPSVAPDGTFSEHIDVTVGFPDGHTERARFPYGWAYPNGEQTDPWSATNLRRGDFAIRLIPPPAGSNETAFPPLIRYVLAHTDADGLSTLVDCPRGGRVQAESRTLASLVPPTRTDPLFLKLFDRTEPDAPVEILELRAGRPGTSHEGLPDELCPVFRDRSPKAVTGVRFTFVVVPGGGAAPRVDDLTFAGSYAPDERVAPNTPCYAIAWDPAIHYGRVAVTAVRFADGSAWEGARPVGPPRPVSP